MPTAPRSPSPSPPRRPRVLVIGAGAAGLSAARALVHSGAPARGSGGGARRRGADAAAAAAAAVEVVVLEARSRPGGRVLTETLPAAHAPRRPRRRGPAADDAWRGAVDRPRPPDPREGRAGKRRRDVAQEEGEVGAQVGAGRKVDAMEELPPIRVDIGASVMHGCADPNQSVFRKAVADGIRAPTVAGGAFYECTEHARWFDNCGKPMDARVVAEMHSLFWLISRVLAARAHSNRDPQANMHAHYIAAKRHVLENMTARTAPLTDVEESVLEKIRIRSFAYCSPMSEMGLHQAAIGMDPDDQPLFGKEAQARGTTPADVGLLERNVSRAAISLRRKLTKADNPVVTVASRRPNLAPDRLVIDGYTPFLIDSLKEGLDIRYNTVVDRVEYQRGEDSKDGFAVCVHTTSGQEYEADYAIVTLPVGVLKGEDPRSAVAFSPPLSDAKQRAIDVMGMGVHNKVILRFHPEDVFWPPGSPQLNCLDPRFQFLNLNAYDKPGVLMAHVFGGNEFARGYDGMSDDDVVAEVLNVLKKMFYGEETQGGDRASLVETLRSEGSLSGSNGDGELSSSDGATKRLRVAWREPETGNGEENSGALGGPADFAAERSDKISSPSSEAIDHRLDGVSRMFKQTALGGRSEEKKRRNECALNSEPPTKETAKPEVAMVLEEEVVVEEEGPLLDSAGRAKMGPVPVSQAPASCGMRGGEAEFPLLWGSASLRNKAGIELEARNDSEASYDPGGEHYVGGEGPGLASRRTRSLGVSQKDLIKSCRSVSPLSVGENGTSRGGDRCSKTVELVPGTRESLAEQSSPNRSLLRDVSLAKALVEERPRWSPVETRRASSSVPLEREGFGTLNDVAAEQKPSASQCTTPAQAGGGDCRHSGVPCELGETTATPRRRNPVRSGLRPKSSTSHGPVEERKSDEEDSHSTIYRPLKKPAVFPQYVCALVTRWDEDPFSLGSYSFLPRGGNWDMIADLAAPEPARTRADSRPTLFFAGEHCDDLGWQCVHGACESGGAAARLLLEEIATGLGELEADGGHLSPQKGELSSPENSAQQASRPCEHGTELQTKEKSQPQPQIISLRGPKSPKYVDAAVAIWQKMATENPERAQIGFTKSELAKVAEKNWDVYLWSRPKHSVWRRSLYRAIMDAATFTRSEDGMFWKLSPGVTAPPAHLFRMPEEGGNVIGAQTRINIDSGATAAVPERDSKSSGSSKSIGVPKNRTRRFAIGPRPPSARLAEKPPPPAQKNPVILRLRLNGGGSDCGSGPVVAHPEDSCSGGGRPARRAAIDAINKLLCRKEGKPVGIIKRKAATPTGGRKLPKSTSGSRDKSRGSREESLKTDRKGVKPAAGHSMIARGGRRKKPFWRGRKSKP